MKNGRRRGAEATRQIENQEWRNRVHHHDEVKKSALLAPRFESITFLFSRTALLCFSFPFSLLFLLFPFLVFHFLFFLLFLCFWFLCHGSDPPIAVIAPPLVLESAQAAAASGFSSSCTSSSAASSSSVISLSLPPSAFPPPAGPAASAMMAGGAAAGAGGNASSAVAAVPSIIGTQSMIGALGSSLGPSASNILPMHSSRHSSRQSRWGKLWICTFASRCVCVCVCVCHEMRRWMVLLERWDKMTLWEQITSFVLSLSLSFIFLSSFSFSYSWFWILVPASSWSLSVCLLLLSAFLPFAHFLVFVAPFLIVVVMGLLIFATPQQPILFLLLPRQGGNIL